jgi:hypothetical protein
LRTGISATLSTGFLEKPDLRGLFLNEVMYNRENSTAINHSTL